MATSAGHRNHGRFHRALEDLQVRLALLVAAALIVEAVLAKNVLDVQLDFVSQFAPMWVFIAYQVSGRHDRRATLVAAVAVVVVTAAVLVVYAV